MEGTGLELEHGALSRGFRERVQRLAIYEPLFRLENKKTTDRQGRTIDYFSLGLLTLLFFYENMLLRYRRAGARELAGYLQKAASQEIDLDAAGFERLARGLVEAFRPASGKRHSRTFYNWESRQEESVFYSLLRADRYDAATNSQYYTLDEQGLELIFATREYFSDLQVSINQLLLRKQLEKGEFYSALRQIDEMRVAVQNLEERMQRIRHEIMRSIISEATYHRYREMVSDINLRLIREDEEFDELLAFVRATRQRYVYEKSDAKMLKTLELMTMIDRELGEVHHLHSLLLRESIGLKAAAVEAARESLYFAGMASFNFQKEISERLFSSPLPLMAARPLAEPFLFLESRQSWPLLSALFPQRLEKGAREALPEYFPEWEESGLNQARIEELSGQFGVIMAALLELLPERALFTLEEVVELMRASQNPAHRELLASRDFYDFCLILHQRSPVELAAGQEESNGGIFAGMAGVLQGQCRVLAVEERGAMLAPTGRYRIRNLEFRLEGWES